MDTTNIGPEPISTSHCPYLGTNYCHDFCLRFFDIPNPDCNLECQNCPYAAICPCHSSSLPWEADIENYTYLVFSPHISIYLAHQHFLRTYATRPNIQYLEDLGLFAARIKST